jgi:hypothetical protein
MDNYVSKPMKLDILVNVLKEAYSRKGRAKTSKPQENAAVVLKK